jgi:tripartite ATP-independent transporter DctM subunit
VNILPLTGLGIAFIAFLIFGAPIAFVLGLASATYLAIAGKFSWAVMAQRMFSIVDSFPLLAVPFFILAAKLMEESGILDSLLELADALVGHVRGGLAHVNIAASMLFAGITGSPTADTAAIGSILIPAMEKDGYETDFSAAVTVASSTIGPIIPPSIPMVIYAMCEGRVSVAALFLAGVIPGILVGLTQMVVAYFISIKKGYSATRTGFVSLKEFVVIFARSFLALLMPLIILGGIFSGIFTPTEAAAAAVGYALIIGLFVTRKLKVRSLVRHLLDTAVVTSVVMFVLAGSSVFGWLITVEMVPQRIANLILEFSRNPLVFLLLVNIFLLIVGCFMNTTAAIVILTPILSPIATSLGIDPLHFGFVVIMNLIIGQITPPVGSCLFVVMGICNTTMERVTKALLPFLAVEIGVLLLITYVPIITLWLPTMLGFH